MTKYGAMFLKKEIGVEVMGITQNIPLVWANGMIGAVAVFDTKEEAVEYAGSETKIFELEISEKDKR